MSNISFEEVATREHVWARAFFMGPTGSGKSRAALELASKIAGDAPITLINTERGRGKLYADRYTYSLIDLSGDAGDADHSPDTFVDAINVAEGRNPGGTIIVDSGSHEWMGKNGVLAQADRFGEWKKVRPMHNDFVDRLMAVRGHVIVCVRAKMKYEVSEEEKSGGGKRQVINMLGVGPIQSDDLQYEFNLVARFDQTTKEATFSGHVEQLQGTVADLFDATDVAEKLSQWLAEGSPPVEPEAATDEAVAALVATLKEEGHKDETIEAQFASHRGKHRGVLDPEWVADQTKKSAERNAAKKKAANVVAEPKPAPAPEPAAA